MHANNGIAGARNNDTLYVANSIAGGITVLETQADHSVVLADFIPTGNYTETIPFAYLYHSPHPFQNTRLTMFLSMRLDMSGRLVSEHTIELCPRTQSLSSNSIPEGTHYSPCAFQLSLVTSSFSSVPRVLEHWY